MAQGFFGRVDDAKEVELFNSVLQIRKKEVVDEISILTAKLNFGYQEARELDIETRRMYLDRVQELFGNKQQSTDQPLSQKEKDQLMKNQNMFGKGQKK